MEHQPRRPSPTPSDSRDSRRDWVPGGWTGPSGLGLGALALMALACRQLPAGEGAGSGYEGARARELARGAELFADHCALCHGPGGAGNGPAAPLLFPPARDFGKGQFLLVSSTGGVPSDADLAAVLRRGLPGSAMPAFGWMPEQDLAALAAHVRHLAERGLGERLAHAAAQRGEPLSASRAQALARERLTPGTIQEVPAPREADDEALTRGRDSYLRSCAVCHGEHGEGRPDEPRWNPDGNLNWARDFTAGVLKGGASHEALARRVLLGLPGTAMAPTVLADADELPDLVRYVQSLIPAGAEQRLVHRTGLIRAARTQAPVPADAEDPRWSRASELEVVLAPLAWSERSVVSARVAALHDGTSVAVRVRWTDETRDDRIGSPARHGDGVSLALTSAPTPPLVGMGSPEHPVNLWHWKAFRAEDAAGLLDLFGGPPHGRPDPLRPWPARLDAPLYQGVPGAGGPGRQPESLHAEGFQSLSPDHPDASRVTVDPRWQEGEWSVVFRRSLAARHERELELLPGAYTLLSLAIWNGSAGDHHGKKSFSIWQRLELE